MTAAHSSTPNHIPPQPQSNALFAALDLGTNNCRLLIAARDEFSDPSLPPSLRVLDSFSRIVKLGEGISQTGVLSEEAMNRTIVALGICKRKLNRFNLTSARLVATEACRKATNTQEFLDKVSEKLDLNIEVISNEEEARLAFLGCSSLLTQTSERAIVFDIGGGSTELMWIDVETAHQNRMKNNKNLSVNEDSAHSPEKKVITDWLSVDSGVMNLADRFGGIGFSDVAYDDMVAYITERIVPFDFKNNITASIGSKKVQMLSTSGTVTTLAAIHLGLPKYDRTRVDGLKLKVQDIRTTIENLRNMRPFERFNHPCIGHERADFILSGCAVFDAISRVWPTGEITIADRGVREGIILSLMQQHG